MDGFQDIFRVRQDSEEEPGPPNPPPITTGDPPKLTLNNAAWADAKCAEGVAGVPPRLRCRSASRA